MRCRYCNERIDAPIAFCPGCGKEISKEDREQLRDEDNLRKAADADTLRNWKKYRIITFVELFAGIVIGYPIAAYFSLSLSRMWILYVFAALWLGLFIFFGFIKGGVRCPFCGSLLGRTGGDHCPHCTKKIR